MTAELAARIEAYPCACPRCGAGIGRPCRSIDARSPGSLMIVHRERRAVRASLAQQELEALDWE